MNSDIIGHIIVSALLIIGSCTLLIFTTDPVIRGAALAALSLVAGWWLPSPSELRAKKNATTA